jgi:anaerobic selenocysteine-containing dehydrogenase
MENRTPGAPDSAAAHGSDSPVAGRKTGTLRVRGCCPLDCQDGCAWVAHVEDGRAVRIEGARDHPFTRGALCAKVNDYPARTYAPDRLLHPLRRVGAKGEGRFERVGWDEALDTIAARFAAIRESAGPEALLPHHYAGSMGVVQRRALVRLFHALGATRLAGGICCVSAVAVTGEGHTTGLDPETTADAKLVLLWGANLLTTAHHHWHFLEEARRRHGTRLICIDPRRTKTAEKCDEHIAIVPGTDRLLAAGMARVLFAEGLADLEFARGVAGDVDALRAEVEPWTPERVEAACGVSPERVVTLAHEFAAARPALIRSGVAPQQTAEGESYVRSLAALAILGGHWRLPGGGLYMLSSPDVAHGKAARPDLLPGPARSLDMARLGETLTDASLAPPILGLMIWGTNPAVVQTDAARVRRGLAREDLFTVVVEHFLTDTARYADIVLPSTTQLEHFDILGSWGHHYIAVNLPAIAPLGEARSHGEIMRQLAARLGLDQPALRESDEAIAASALPPDLDLEALKANGWQKRPGPLPFAGRTGLRLGGFAGPPADRPAGRLQLLTPKSHWFLNTSFTNMPRQRRAMGVPTAEMNARDAAVRGLKDGQDVVIRNETGELRARLAVTETVLPGALALPGKWWSQPPETAAVPNLLLPAGWSAGGQPAYNEIWVEVTGESGPG